MFVILCSWFYSSNYFIAITNAFYFLLSYDNPKQVAKSYNNQHASIFMTCYNSPFFVVWNVWTIKRLMIDHERVLTIRFLHHVRKIYFFVIKELFFLKCDKSQIIECHQRFKYHVTKIEFYWKAIYKAK